MMLSSGVVSAPFILTESEVKVADSKIQLQSCGINKLLYSRYYWYDAKAQEDGYLIDINTVNFAVFNGLRRGAYVTTINPLAGNPKLEILAYGSYHVLEKASAIRCVPRRR